MVKVPSTPRSLHVGAFRDLGTAGVEPATVTDLVHGSTVATNAILERRGARIAFVATAGFHDILFMQRHDRRNIYDLHCAKPKPPMYPHDCFKVMERIDAAGVVITSLDEAGITREFLPALQARLA
ncbi:MAG: hydantoinase/oxoprolinase N-terminal domain-containing protein [Janthinobacterium lividum]